MLLITGLASSGTTFTARLYQACGADLGTQLTPGSHRGMEHKPVAHLFSGLQSQGYDWHKDQLRVAKKLHKQIVKVSEECPQCVKAPWLTRWLPAWLLGGGQRPEHVTVCLRSAEAISASSLGLKDINKILSMQAHLLHIVTVAELNCSVVYFPRSVRDTWYMFSRMPAALHLAYTAFADKHLSVADSTLVHQEDPGYWSALRG